MLDTNEINTNATQAEDSFEGGITGRWETEDDVDGTVFDEETETEITRKREKLNHPKASSPKIAGRDRTEDGEKTR